MKKFVNSLLAIIVFLLAFSTGFRILFLICHSSFFQIRAIQSLWYGLDFDMGIVLIVGALTYLWAWIFRGWGLKYFLFFLIWIQFFFTAVDIQLYQSWDSVFSIRAMKYLSDPIEISRNISNSSIFIFGLASIGVYIAYHFIYDKFHLGKKITSLQLSVISKICCLLLLSAIAFLWLRGGLRPIPRNQSDAYFCQDKIYNIAVLNSTWNFIDVIVQSQRIGAVNPYIKMSDDKARHLLEELFQAPTEVYPSPFRSSTTPNIILITMEGISAELFSDSLAQSTLPYIQQLKEHGYSLERAYAIGHRTEQGITAMLSGTLTTPYDNMTDNINRLPEIPSILTSFRERGYYTEFLFGGDIEFGKMRAYLTEKGINKIVEKSDFLHSQRLQKLGVPDGYLFERAYTELEGMKTPFLLQIMTQSTHQPFDIPYRKIAQNDDLAYEQSARYMDSCIGRFVQKIQRKNYWENTILIITSDHSHKYPSSIDIATPMRFHIPFIVISPLLTSEYIGAKTNLIYAQNDLPATLSHWLGWRERNYLPYSKNYFSNQKKFCFSTFVNGYFYQIDSLQLQYDYIWRPIDTTSPALVRQHSYPMAIMQRIADDILGR